MARNPENPAQQAIVDQLRASMVSLRALGVERLALFGSQARGDATAQSDVDVLVGFVATPTIDGYFAVVDDLERALGRRVDVVMEGAIKPRLRASVEQELIRVA